MHADSRNFALDAMWGIGAISVLLFHLDHVLSLAPAGFLAVDFFFALSGFVIALAYDEKLRRGMSFRTFAWRRLVRLYPIYLTGLLLGLAAFVFAMLSSHLGLAKGLKYFVFGALMLPTPWAEGNMFPLNSPAWTLFFEMAINALFALVLFRLRTLGLLVWTVVCGLLLVASLIHEGNLGGWSWATFHIGVLRVSFSFGVGMLLARHTGRRTISWLSLLPILLFGLVLYVPIVERLYLPWAVPTILAISPAVLFAASRVELPQQLHPVATLLGDLSYPLYATHVPTLFFSEEAARAFGLGAAMTVGVCVVSSLCVAYLVNTWVPRVVGLMSGRRARAAKLVGST